MSYYCDYCGYSYIKLKCVVCGDTIEVCGCDCGRRVCEEHYCANCGETEIHDGDLDNQGICPSCIERRGEKMESKWRKYWYLMIFGITWLLMDLVLKNPADRMIIAGGIFISMMTAYILVDTVNFFYDIYGRD